MRAAILVNSTANNNTGDKKWAVVKSRVMELLPPDTVVITYKTDFDIEGCIRDLTAGQGVDCIISAGGDGSINIILNAILACLGESSRDISLGAVGLGSSNDFLKPYSSFIAGIPVKIDTTRVQPADVGKVSYFNKEGERHSRHFIVNASVGVTAEANLLFNRGDPFIRRIKDRFINLAILYAALKTIIIFKNKQVDLSYDDMNEKINATNISVVKNPNISGNFRYDQEIRMNDGYLGLNYFYDLNKTELLEALYDLSKGRFSGKPKRRSALTKNVRISSADPLALETDGEVTFVNNIEFSIIPGAINILG